MSENSKNEIEYWDVHVREDKPEKGLYEIQWQTPKISIQLIAKDLSFAKSIIDFIDETRNNSNFRDIPLGNGVYERLIKELDLSQYFVDTSICIGKDGEFDSSYYMRISSGQVWIGTDICDKEIDSFLETLNEIVEDWWIQK